MELRCSFGARPVLSRLYPVSHLVHAGRGCTPTDPQNNNTQQWRTGGWTAQFTFWLPHHPHHHQQVCV